MNPHIDDVAEPVRAAEVGRKESAYRLCYGVVTMELAERRERLERARLH